MSNRVLSLEEIMAVDDITEKQVEIPEWGGSVIVKSISHRDMRAISKSAGGDEDEEISEEEIEKWVFIKGMVQPQVDEAAYEKLIDKSTGAISKILTEILGRSKSGDEATKKAEKSISTEPAGVLPVQSGGIVGDDGSATVDGEAPAAFTL